MDHFLYLVFLMLSRLFIAALWSPAGTGLTSWLLLVMSIIFLLLSHLVFWVRCVTWLYRFLIFVVFLTSLFVFTTEHVFCLAQPNLIAHSISVELKRRNYQLLSKRFYNPHQLTRFSFSLLDANFVILSQGPL